MDAHSNDKAGVREEKTVVHQQNAAKPGFLSVSIVDAAPVLWFVLDKTGILFQQLCCFQFFNPSEGAKE